MPGCRVREVKTMKSCVSMVAMCLAVTLGACGPGKDAGKGTLPEELEVAPPW